MTDATNPAELDFYPFGESHPTTFAPAPPICRRRGVISHRCSAPWVDPREVLERQFAEVHLDMAKAA